MCGGPLEESVRCSLLSHTSNVNDLLEGLDGVLEDWLDGLHDTESSFHIVDLWLHALDGLHLSGNFNEWLSIIKSLQNSSSKKLLATAASALPLASYIITLAYHI